ncbi:MAG TPA: hypothetical protein VK550_30885 [Polyangiaceae bacterium]|nr:hypothetical protein [Polyangiaceae bacterium]
MVKATNDNARITEGRELAKVCMREVFAVEDIGDMTLVLAHEGADAYDLVLQRGADLLANGWIVLVGTRPKLPPGCTIPRDELLLTICAGKMNVITSVAYDDLVSLNCRVRFYAA